MNEVTNNQQYQPMRVGEWILTFILTGLPLIGFIMMFVWAFSSGTHPSKQSWAKAYLIFMAIWSALVALIFVFMGGLWWFLSPFGDYDNHYYEEDHHLRDYDEKSEWHQGKW